METAAHRQIRRIVPFVLIVTASCPLAPAKIIHVDDDAAGVGDGTNWTDAYVCLQDALTATQYGDEIHIAEGIYQIKDARVFSYQNVR